MSRPDVDEVDEHELTPALLLARRRRSRRAPGREPSLTRRQIVTAAIELADAEGAEGAEGVTMRRLARQLGVATATLYGYVETRDELLTHMLDAALAEVRVPDSASGDWRADLRHIARELLNLCRRHPWLSPLLGPRMYLLGHHAARLTDFGISVLMAAGLDLPTIQGVLSLVNNFVIGTALREGADTRLHRAGREEADAGLDVAIRAYLQTVIASRRYPGFAAMAKVTLDGGDRGPDDRFEFGLECVIIGVAGRLGLP